MPWCKMAPGLSLTTAKTWRVFYLCDRRMKLMYLTDRLDFPAWASMSLQGSNKFT
jgi:hypothetical protein